MPSIIQFTDTHYFAAPDGKLMGVDTAETFQEVSKLAQKHSGTPDFYLITGDISQDESQDSYRRFAGAISHVKAPVYFLQGNHDSSGSMSEPFNQPPFVGDKSFSAGNWRLILLNTQQEGQVGGYLNGDELTRLENELSAHSHSHCFIALHHPPLPVGSKWIDKIGVANGQDFLSVIDRYASVRAVLCGHIHQEFSHIRKGVHFLGTPSTCVQFKPQSDDFALDIVPPGYRWLTLHDDGTIETAVVRLSTVAKGLDTKSRGY